MIQEIERRHVALRTRKGATTTRPASRRRLLTGRVLTKAEEFNLVYLRKVGPNPIKERTVEPGFFFKCILKSFRELNRVAFPPMLAPKGELDNN